MSTTDIMYDMDTFVEWKLQKICIKFCSMIVVMVKVKDMSCYNMLKI